MSANTSAPTEPSVKWAYRVLRYVPGYSDAERRLQGSSVRGSFSSAPADRLNHRFTRSAGRNILPGVFLAIGGLQRIAAAVVVNYRPHADLVCRALELIE